MKISGLTLRKVFSKVNFKFNQYNVEETYNSTAYIILKVLKLNLDNKFLW